MTPNCSVGMDDFAKEEVPVTLGATIDGTDADLVCSITSTGDELTPLPGVMEALCIPRLSLWLLFSLSGQISTFFPLEMLFVNFSLIFCCLQFTNDLSCSLNAVLLVL